MSSDLEYIVSLKNVGKKYKNTEVLKNVSLSLCPNTQYVIHGASGSGKSTLLHLMGGLEAPTSGSVFFLEKDMGLLSDTQMSAIRNHDIGFIFQHHFLLNSLSNWENMILPLRISGTLNAQNEEVMYERAKLVGVAECLNRFPQEISGGQQQRIGILRALAMNPKLLLCDEPTGNLDSENAQIVVSLLRSLTQEFKTTLVIVTHDKEIMSQFENSIHIKDGSLTTQNSF